MADKANPDTLPQGPAPWGLVKVGGRVNTFSHPGEQPSLPDMLAIGVGKAHRTQVGCHYDMRNHARTAGTPSSRVR